MNHRIKLRQGEWITLAQFACGCQVREVPYEVIKGLANATVIEYCPKHKAAPDMYEALTRFLESSACTNNCDPDDMTCDTNFAKKALAKAEGKC